MSVDEVDLVDRCRHFLRNKFLYIRVLHLRQFYAGAVEDHLTVLENQKTGVDVAHVAVYRLHVLALLVVAVGG